MRSLFLDELLADSPLILWEGQEASGLPQDTSGNGNHATSANPSAYKQDGPMDDASIQLPGGASVARAAQGQTTTITMEVLYAVQALPGATQTLFYNGNGGANGYGIVIGQASQLRVVPLLGGILLGNYSGAIITNTGSGGFDHVALRRNADGTWNHFLNGAKFDSGLGANSPGAPSGSIGLLLGSSSHQFLWAYFAFYVTALPDARMAEHFAATRSLARRGVIL